MLVQPAMSIASGFIRMDSGRVVQVIGMDQCPEAGYMQIGKIQKMEGRQLCTLVPASNAQFYIMTGTSKGMSNELWTVERSPSSIRLVRPNGEKATIIRTKS